MKRCFRRASISGVYSLARVFSFAIAQLENPSGGRKEIGQLGGGLIDWPLHVRRPRRDSNPQPTDSKLEKVPSPLYLESYGVYPLLSIGVKMSKLSIVSMT